MAKVNFQYVKSHPIMFGAIVVVFGLLFWLLINRGGDSGSGGGSVNVMNSGPSDAQVQAGVALQSQQIQAQTQVAMGQMSLNATAMQIDSQQTLAALEMQLRVQELAVEHDMGSRTIEASLAALALQTGAQVDMAADNNAFMLGYARQAQDSAIQMTLINATLQRDLGAQQLEGFKFSGMMQAIGSLKKKDRDDTLERIYGNPEAMALNPNIRTGDSGGGFFSGALGFVSPIARLAS